MSIHKGIHKEIRKIAAQLPPMQEANTSGFTIENGKMKPHVYFVAVNHARRMKRAYQRCGEAGVLHYLATVEMKQKAAHDKFAAQKAVDISKAKDLPLNEDANTENKSI